MHMAKRQERINLEYCYSFIFNRGTVVLKRMHPAGNEKLNQYELKPSVLNSKIMRGISATVTENHLILLDCKVMNR
jgi:hypothetical protein